MIKNFLLPLTPSKSFYIFSLSFFIATVLIFLDYYTPWSPAVVVVLYGGLLWYVQNKLFQVLNDSIRNSPYFLGFLLTLVALFVIFLRTGESGIFLKVDEGDIGFIFRQIGSALTTTIVGLLFRQALTTFDPGEDQRTAIFQSLMDELRENASTYKQTQRELIKVLKDFVNTREELYQKEEQMSSKYLSLMSRNYEDISQLLQKYPPQLNSLFKGIDETLKEFREKIINNITKTHDALKNVCEIMIDRIPAQIDSLNNINNILKSSIDGLSLFNNSLRGFQESTKMLPLEITNTCNSLKKNMEEYETTLKGRLNMLEKEIKSINMIIDEFINITTDKVQKLK